MKNIHWPYYLSFESDIVKVSRYIEFNEENYSTYSLELARLLLASSSEVDVVMKELCRFLAPTEKIENINDYKNIIKSKSPGLVNQKITCARYGLEFTPWKSWILDESPAWWVGHNKVKHHRSENFQEANLKNVLDSISGLYVCNVYFNHYLVKSKSDWPYDLSNTVSGLQVQLDLFRIDCPFTYLRGN